jgi:hypothetical protein
VKTEATSAFEQPRRRLILQVERFKELTPAQLGEVHGGVSAGCQDKPCNTSSSDCIRDED